MQPAARLSAAIEILDQYLSGSPAEKALTNWARRSRFAGSKDRAAIRDIVFDCLRRRKSYAARVKSETGRGLVIGHVVSGPDETDIDTLFSGTGHAPPCLDAIEKAALTTQNELDWAATHDMPEWLRPELEASLGDKLADLCSALRQRAPVFLRVNSRKAIVDDVQAELAESGIVTRPHPLASSALEVIENPRKIVTSAAYLEGRIELQDVASQSICESLPAAKRMLDYCAGGGGKVLAYGASHDAALFAHDAMPARLRDLKTRGTRAGIDVTEIDRQQAISQAPFDLVLCDVPCSGSGSWRRAPEGKWAHDGGKLAALHKTQSDILDEAATLVADGGHLVYVTCSVLKSENHMQKQKFIARNSSFELRAERQYLPADGGDGFYMAHLTRDNACT